MIQVAAGEAVRAADTPAVDILEEGMAVTEDAAAAERAMSRGRKCKIS